MRRATLARSVCLLLAGFSWPPLDAAAQQTGSIAGLVTDASGSVLPGVTVEASSPALIERVRVVVTSST